MKDLNHILNFVQRHTNHGQHCLRKNNSQVSICRFRYPKAVTQDSAFVKNERTEIFEPKRNDESMGKYNPYFTSIWRANTDISPISNSKEAAEYIGKYAGKAETASLSYITTMRSQMNAIKDTDTRKVISKFFVRSLGDRDYSAQEVIHILMDWPLYRCSRSFVTVNLGKEQWLPLSLNDNDTTNNAMKISQLKKYLDRNILLENYNFLQFLQGVKVQKETVIIPEKSKIVRIFPKLYKTGDLLLDQKYYQQKCILLIPFRGNINSILMKSTFENWSSLYFAYFGKETNDEPTLFDLDQTDEIAISNPADYLERNAFEHLSSVGSDEDYSYLGLRLIDLNYQWNYNNNRFPPINVAELFLENFANYSINNAPHSASIQYSAEQTDILNLVDKQIKFLKENNNISGRITDFPRTIYLQGKAGSGKSTIIEEIRYRVEKELSPDAISLVAPTGVAAHHINGCTIHSAFGIPVNRKPYEQLNGPALLRFTNRFRNVKFLIIDEHSMISARILSFIEKRVHEIHPNEPDQLFPGLFVYFFGDIRQLVPVLDLPMYIDPTNITNPELLYGINVFRNFEKYVELQLCQRQKGDNNFSEFLDRLANGDITDTDYAMLCARRESVLSLQEKQKFENAIRLFRKNDDVDAYNEYILRCTNLPVARIVAKSSGNFEPNTKKDRQSGMANVLLLSIGTRVMLRRNLCTPAGLVNGAIGVVKYIVYHNKDCPPKLPSYVLIEFDNYKGPYFVEKCIPILPVEFHWTENNQECTTVQLPLSIAHAITFYKSQGLTLENAVIDISNTEGTSAGGTYVAISRLRCINDLMLKIPYSKDRWNITNLETHKRKMKALEFIRSRISEQ